MDPIHPFGSEIKTTAIAFCYNTFGSSLRSTARQIIHFRKTRRKKKKTTQMKKEQKEMEKTCIETRLLRQHRDTQRSASVQRKMHCVIPPLRCA